MIFQQRVLQLGYILISDGSSLLVHRPPRPTIYFFSLGRKYGVPSPDVDRWLFALLAASNASGFAGWDHLWRSLCGWEQVECGDYTSGVMVVIRAATLMTVRG